MRIYADKLYVVRSRGRLSPSADPQGVTQPWDETRIVQGRTVKARELRADVVRQFRFRSDPLNRSMVRLEDGRLPDYQEVVKVGAWFSNAGWNIGPGARYPSVVVLSAPAA